MGDYLKNKNFKKTVKELTAIIETTKTGYSAYLKEYSGVIGVGSTLPEVKESIRESLFHHNQYNLENNKKQIGSITYFECTK